MEAVEVLNVLVFPRITITKFLIVDAVMIVTDYAKKIVVARRW